MGTVNNGKKSAQILSEIDINLHYELGIALQTLDRDGGKTYISIHHSVPQSGSREVSCRCSERMGEVYGCEGEGDVGPGKCKWPLVGDGLPRFFHCVGDVIVSLRAGYVGVITHHFLADV